MLNMIKIYSSKIMSELKKKKLNIALLFNKIMCVGVFSITFFIIKYLSLWCLRWDGEKANKPRSRSTQFWNSIFGLKVCLAGSTKTAQFDVDFGSDSRL